MEKDRRPAVFLDRDGVVTVERKRISLPNEIELYPFASDAIRMLKGNGYLVIVVTNQSGVARGLFKEDELKIVHDEIKEKTGVDAIYYCPHHPKGSVESYGICCNCRKPQIGLLDKANKAFVIDYDKSWMVGDRAADIQFGIKAGLKTILVKTGYGGEDMPKELQPNYVCEDLFQAVEVILNYWINLNIHR